jgi:hypothetical protein
MPQVGFERTISFSERAKTVHALDRAASVIGSFHNLVKFNQYYENRFRENRRFVLGPISRGLICGARMS